MKIFEDWVDSEAWADVLTLGLFLIGAIALYLLLRLLYPLASRAARNSRWGWDDMILDPKLRHRLSLLGPAAVFYLGARLVTDATSIEPLQRASAAVLALLVAASLSAALHAANVLYETKPVSRDKPIEAYIQIVQIVVYLFGVVFAVAALADRPPWFFVGGLGALTAVLLLVFRDTILSLVASIQLAQADLIDVGDWIEVPAFGADGDVVDVALHSITVQNFDKTITAIPTHQLINEAFKNWRGMAELGRRRIKRQLHIDVGTVRFLTDEEVAQFASFEPIRDYMEAKISELAAQRANHPDDSDPRRLTNIGTFRAYVASYLSRIDTVDTEGMTFLVRQLQPGPHGLPLEVYVFANTSDWVQYEAIQADIFDHILAMVPEFGLRLFQEPSGADVRVSAPEQN